MSASYIQAQPACILLQISAEEVSIMYAMLMMVTGDPELSRRKYAESLMSTIEELPPSQLDIVTEDIKMTNTGFKFLTEDEQSDF